MRSHADSRYCRGATGRARPTGVVGGMEDRPVAQLMMRRPHLDAIPAPAPLPAGYALPPLREGEDLAPLAATLAAAFADRWDEAPDVRAVYAVIWRDRPVATAASRELPARFPGAGYLHWVGTDPTHGRRGLASALVTRVLRDFADRGDTAAVLETDDFRLPAIRTYLKFGFLPVYEVDGEAHDARWTAVFQRLFAR